MKILERRTCRACGADLEQEAVVDFGWQGVVDFPEPGQSGRGDAPLTLVRCSNEQCGLLQLRYSVDPDILYRQFFYKSSMNEQMRAELKDVAHTAERMAGINPGDIVVDVGANDGYLLGQYLQRGLTRVAFEPAKNFVPEHFDGYWMSEYFGKASWPAHLHQRKAKIITAVAMFYDVEEPGKFLADAYELLEDDGVLLIQQNYVRAMVQNTAYDNICHEHLCYYGLRQMRALLNRAGLTIVDVRETAANGGSFRVMAQKTHTDVGDTRREPLKVERWIDREAEMDGQVQNFRHSVDQNIKQLRQFLVWAKQQGKKVYGYGASTRGTLVLQMVLQGLDPLEYLPAVAERDGWKIGKLMSSRMKIPIINEDVARKEADYLLVLPWHFWNSIKEREKLYRQNGGRLVVPLPYPRVARAGDEVVTLEQEMQEVGVVVSAGT